jgi:hypothetical protein
MARMSCQYFRDDSSRCVKIILTDPVIVQEMIETVDRQLAEGAWNYGTLVDARQLLAQIPSADLRTFVSHIRELVAANGPRGPIAIAARGHAAVAGGQMYTFFGKDLDLSVEVFWDIEEAKDWLRQHTP